MADDLAKMSQTSAQDASSCNRPTNLPVTQKILEEPTVSQIPPLKVVDGKMKVLQEASRITQTSLLDTNQDKTTAIRILKISPSAGTTFLSKSDMESLLSHSEAVPEKIQKIDFSHSTTLSKTTNKVTYAETKSDPIMIQSVSSTVQIPLKSKPNILKRKSSASQNKLLDQDKPKTQTLKHNRKSPIIPKKTIRTPRKKRSPKIRKKDLSHEFVKKTPENKKINFLPENLNSIHIPLQAKPMMPTLFKMRKKFGKDTLLCSFCHLPAKHSGLGDLYGPYRPSAKEIINKAKPSTKNQYKIEINNNSSEIPIVTSPQVVLDKMEEECNISIPHSSHHSVKDNSSTTGQLNSNIASRSGELRTELVIDHLLQDQSAQGWQKRLEKLNPLYHENSLRLPGLKNSCTIIRTNDKTSSEDKSCLIPNVSTINVLKDSDELVKFSYNKRHRGECVKMDKIVKIGISDIWVHGQCALWASQVYAIGDKIYGLCDAIEESKLHLCTICGLYGATIAKKNSNLACHYPCAILTGIKLNENTYTVD